MANVAPPKRPYLLRAMHQWISDCGNTPHVIVDAERAGSEIPKAYIKEGKIVLNLSPSATQRLKLGNDDIEFDARFAGVVHHVSFPRQLGDGHLRTRDGGGHGVFGPGPRPPSRLAPPPPKKAPPRPAHVRS